LEDVSEEMFQSKAQTKKKMRNMKKRVRDTQIYSIYFVKSSKGRIDRWRRDNILRVMTEVFVELMINVNIHI